MTTPFIKLLQNPKGYYFFDVNRNEIVSIDQGTFMSIQDVLGGKCEMKEAMKSNPRLMNIVGKGYLSSKRPRAIRHHMLDVLGEYLAHKVEQLTLQLTQNCNFRCKYCLYSGGAGDKQRTHSNTTMSLETALLAVDFLCEHSRDSSRVAIGFYGGEPLLEFDLLKKVVEYADEKFEGKDLMYTMTTNGSFLKPGIVEFCLEHKIFVLVSLDGPKEIHDKNRRLAHNDEGTFDLVVRNLHAVRAAFPQFADQLRINMVMDPRNDADCTNELFASYDIFSRDRSSATIVDPTYARDSFEATADFIAKNEYNNFLSFMYHFGRVDKNQVSTLALTTLNRILSDKERMGSTHSLPDVMAPGGPCLPGVLRGLVDVHGNLFPCERCSETSTIMRIGSLREGFDVEHAKAILDIGALTEEDCRDCWAIGKCTVCASQIEEGNAFSAEKKRKRCAAVRDMAERNMQSIIMFHEMERYLKRREETKVHA